MASVLNVEKLSKEKGDKNIILNKPFDFSKVKVSILIRNQLFWFVN